MTTKPKRYEYHITYDRKSKMWMCKVGGALVIAADCKEWLVNHVSGHLAMFVKLGQHSELIIHRKDGTIGKGSSSRRSYGADPKSRG